LGRLPEHSLVDPVGFLQHTVRKAERFKHLHGAAGDTVSLSEFEWTGLLINEQRPDLRECRQLCGERQACWPAADDQHVDLAGKSTVIRRRMGALSKSRIASAKDIEVNLHRKLPHTPRRSMFRTMFSPAVFLLMRLDRQRRKR